MYKSMLQELCHQRKWRSPEYNTTKGGPDHAPRFSATVTVNGFDFHTVDTFRSSKEAQNDAAKHAFDHLPDHLQPKPRNPIPSPSSFPQPCLPSSSSAPSCLDIQHFHKNQLQIYAQKRNLLPPVYSCEREGPPHNSRFKCRVTIGGQTYKGQEFLPTLKDAEHAAAKAALKSILPNGVQEDDSGLFKNLLQELIQKEGFSVPVYSSRMSGEPHVPIFVSSVEIEGETFMGQEARSKKQAELNVAKVAYITLRERKSSQLPLVSSSARKGQEASEILSSSFQSNRAAELHQQARPNAPAIFSPNMNTKEQKNEKNVIAEGKRQRLITVSSGPCTSTSGGEGSSSDVVHGRAQETNHKASPNGSTSCVMVSSLEPLAKRSAYNRVSVYSRKLNIEYPEGTTMLPMSDETWVVCSHT